jgi:hypothetical protein
MPIRNQLNIRGNKHTSIATNCFWMQQPHELLQQRLHFRQRYFIVATGIPTRNQLNIRGNTHLSQRIIFWMQQAHELSQQMLNF